MKRDIEPKLHARERDSIHKEKDYANLNIKVQLMGILNLSPDSFYQGSRLTPQELAMQMIEDGVDILDIGAVSTRPGATAVSEDEELQRLAPIWQTIVPYALAKGVTLSIDTTRARVAALALSHGITLLNDITALADPAMRTIAKKSHARVCLMHMQGTPQTMQQAPHYPHGVVADLISWFQARLEVVLSEGIAPENIILDPGIGFGKTVEDNYTILKNISAFKALGYPVLIGLSRKSFMAKILGKSASQLLSTTLALNTMSILEGADIIRVHDVKEHREIITALCPILPYSSRFSK